jgi:hypothetical protein
MPDAGTARIEASTPGAPSPAQAETPTHPWRTLLWKLALAAVLLVTVLFGIPSTDRALLFLLSTTLILWGGLFVGGSLWGLLVVSPRLKPLWIALALCAYAALAIPALSTGDVTRTLDALGPVVALTLAAQLGRYDLAGALRDWATLMGIALYAALGVLALWSLLPFGPTLFAFAVLLPPIVAELLLLVLRRTSRMGETARQTVAALASALISTVAISFTQLNIRTPAGWAIFFTLAIGVLIGSALLLSLLSRSLFNTSPGSTRALVELTHGALLIGLAIYIPLRLFAL